MGEAKLKAALLGGATRGPAQRPPPRTPLDGLILTDQHIDIAGTLHDHMAGVMMAHKVPGDAAIVMLCHSIGAFIALCPEQMVPALIQEAAKRISYAQFNSRKMLALRKAAPPAVESEPAAAPEGVTDVQ